MEQPEEHVAIRVGRLGRIVHIPDVAYNTYVLDTLATAFLVSMSSTD